MRLALVHGFTQTGRSWAPLLPLLPGDVVTPDLPGHGSRSDVDADLWEGAELLADEVGPAVWVGYSMGGRLCLHLALARPDVVEGLVLVSTTAGIEDRAERAARRAADDALADEIERLPIATVVDRWLAQPMWATLADPGRDARLANDPKGLASALRRAGTGAQDDLWPRLRPVPGALVVTGALDAKFDAIGRRLAAALGAPHRSIAGAGHAVPWERPVELCRAITAQPRSRS